VVAGWTIAYIVKSIQMTVTQFETATEAGKYFAAFVANPYETLFYHALFMSLCVGIVIKGVHSGIEKWCGILMPTLLIILLLLMVRSLTLEGAWAGVEFYLKPDFSKLTVKSFLVALGHAFFSLSLGMGAMITYGSYLSQKENLAYSAFLVALLDTFIALVAGLMIFPAVFAMGLEPAAGPGLVFHVLPAVFSKMPFGNIVSIAFFTLLAIAALTSGISLLEVVVAYFIDEKGWSRKKAVYIVSSVIFVLGIPSALSFGIWGDFKLLNLNFFDLVDQVASNYLLPIGGFFICIFVGWVWGSKKALEEIHLGEHKFPFATGWVILVKYVSPIAVLIIFVDYLIRLFNS
jgi:NSS family neurotransmitter:Na+ symporter